jgi:Uma2 family endonuclease
MEMVTIERPTDEPPAIDTVVPHRWTREEYERMVDAGAFEGLHIELLDGVVYEMTPQSSPHAGVTAMIAEELRPIFGAAFEIRQQLPFRLSARSLPEPDLAVVPADPQGRHYISGHPAKAALLIEVSDSSLRHDRERKQRRYAQAGIPEYWIVNLVAKRLEVYREPGSKGYASRVDLGLEDSIAPLARPDAEILVARLLP